jgi:hypothetical protein
MDNIVSLSVSGVVAWAWLVSRRNELQLLSRDAWAVVAACLVVPVVVVVIAIITVVHSNATKLSWVMANDAVWNTYLSRFIDGDGGLVSSIHHNAAPLTNELMASIFAVGRSGVAAAGLLEHDISGEMQVILVVTTVSSILASVLASRALCGRPRLRALFAVGAGLIPWTWFIGGAALKLGFYNVSIVTCVLAAVWLVWLESEHSPRTGTAILLVGGLVLLAIWAPLAVLACGLALAAAIASRRSLTAMRGKQLAVWLFCVLLFALYVLLVTLPDLRREPSTLANNGAIIDISWLDVLTGVAVMLIVVMLGSGDLARRWEKLGAFVLVVVGGAAMAYLVSARLALPEPWGYYPAKFGWFLCILALLVAGSSAVRNVGNSVGRGWRTAGQSLASVLVVAIILIQVPPPSWGIFSVFPALSIARSNGLSNLDAEAQKVLDLSLPTSKSMLVRYYPSAAQDAFVNSWLLQQSAQSNTDAIRFFVYHLDPSSPIQICSAVSAWGGNVTLVTRDDGLTAEMNSACPDGDFRVDFST